MGECPTLLSKVRSLLNQGLTKQKGLISIISRTALWIFPTKFIRSSRSLVSEEYQRIKRVARGFPNKKLVLILDDSSNSPGLGDKLVMLMVAKYLSDLGKMVEVRQVGASEVSLASTRSLTSFLGLNVIEVDPHRIDLEHEMSEHVIFHSNVMSRADISSLCLSLISRVYLCRELNPKGIRPSCKPPEDVPEDRNFTENKVGLQVGIGVRNSSTAVFRNPPQDTIVQDLLSISRAFPASQIKWFGEVEQFERVSAIVQQVLSSSGSKLSYQTSTDFFSAITEVQGCDVWVQRFGGGINIPIIFSSIPYVLITNDIAAVRMVDYRKGKIASWAEPLQFYLPKIMGPLLPIDRTLKKLSQGLNP